MQPYHAGLDLPAQEGQKAIARLVRVVEHFSHRSVAELLSHYRHGGNRILGLGIVVGSDIDPATIANDHIRAHAQEGRLFRTVIEVAARKCGLATTVMVESRRAGLLAQASRALGRPERQLKGEVTALGRGLGRPWRTEQKAATLAAWMVLGDSTE
jgi:hypothetical protein